MADYRHYLRVDARNRPLRGFSDAFDAPAAGDILLREDGGYQFRLFPGGEENPPLTDWDGVHLYRYENGAVREATAGERASERAELAANRPAPGPTDAERLAALEAAMLAVMGVYHA